MPPSDPRDRVVWLGLLFGLTASEYVDGVRYEFRAPTPLSKSSWQYSVPVLVEHADALLEMRTTAAPMPNRQGKVTSVAMRDVPKYQRLDTPPDWRRRLRGATHLQPYLGGTAVPQAASPDVDTKAIAAQAKEDARIEDLERHRAAIRDGRLSPDTVRSMVNADLLPRELLDEIPGSQDPEAAAVVDMAAADVRDELGDTIDLAWVDRIEIAEKAREKGPRKAVLGAIAAARKRLSNVSSPATEPPGDQATETETPAAGDDQPDALDP